MDTFQTWGNDLWRAMPATIGFTVINFLADNVLMGPMTRLMGNLGYNVTRGLEMSANMLMWKRMAV